jgi:hypothetical protein
VVRSPLHGVTDLSGRGLVRRLCGTLLHFLFCLQIDETVFGEVVGCAAVVHAVQRFECVGPSTTTSVVVQSFTSLAALCRSLVKISLMPFLRRCSKSFLPIFWRPAAIKIDVVY